MTLHHACVMHAGVASLWLYPSIVLLLLTFAKAYSQQTRGLLINDHHALAGGRGQCAEQLCTGECRTTSADHLLDGLQM